MLDPAGKIRKMVSRCGRVAACIKGSLYDQYVRASMFKAGSESIAQ